MLSNGVIDSHVHVWTPDVLEYPLAAGYSTAQMQPSRFTPEDYWAIAQPLGVRRAVLIQMDFYGVDDAFLLDSLKRFPGAFAGVTQIDETRPDLVVEIKRRYKLGVRGVRIAPSKRGDRNWLDNPGMRLLWSCGASEHVAMCPLIDVEDIGSVAHMCAQFPETSVVVDHAANIGSDGQFREHDLVTLCQLAKYKQAYVKVSAFYYLGAKRPPYASVAPLIRRLLDAYGPERLMWGSDCPFQLAPPNTLRASLELVRDQLAFIDSDAKEWLLERTASKVFFS